MTRAYNLARGWTPDGWVPNDPGEQPA
jgi:hypothetical protein